MGKATRSFQRWLCLAIGLLVVGSGAAQAADPDEPIAVSAVDLTKEWEKYKGKTVIVEGVFRTKTRLVADLLILRGSISPKEKEESRVFCHLKAGAKTPQFRPGQTVKVRGRCEGPNGSSAQLTIDLKDCEVVE